MINKKFQQAQMFLNYTAYVLMTNLGFAKTMVTPPNALCVWSRQ
jgi:hypothetical protein